MGALVRNISRYLGNHKGLVIIVISFLLLELISAVQYYYTHNMLEKELEKHAESELRLKAVTIIGMLKVMENTLKEHLWDVERNISHADSMYEATKRVIMVNPIAKGSFLAFSPNYYPEKGRLFEPYAYKENDSIYIRNLGNRNGSDYTTHPVFVKMLEDDEPFWSDPYDYEDDGIVNPLTTYSYPVHDKKGRLAAIGGVDISLEWLGDTLNAHHSYPSSFILLLTESGELISRAHSEHVDSQEVDMVVRMINDSTVRRSESKSGKSNVVRFKDDKGNGASIYYANMKGKPHWQVAMVCYDNEVYGSLRWMRINMLVFMLLAFGILGLIIRRFFLSERKLSMAKMEKERIGNELQIATGIQNSMLAQDEGVADRSDIIVGATLKPAREVGGDLYNYFIRDEKLFFCIGDVSGKGIPSALIMAMTQALFSAVSAHESNPAHIVSTINKTGCRNNKANMFATLFIGVLDLPTGRLRFCNAGHDAPFLINAKDISPLPVKANLPVGLFDDFIYELQEIVLTKGDTLFLYTDGLTEARNVGHQQFGMKRVMDALKQLQDKQPEEMVQSMIERAHQFAGEEEQSDDLTILVFRYSPQMDDYVEHGELTLKNDISQLKELHDFLKSVAGKIGLDASLTRNIRLAVEEAVVNVMDYAYPAGSEGLIHVKAMSDSNCLKLVITDSGVAFNPTEAAEADTTLSAEDRPVGGLGILLVREMMDSINYERIEGKNILTLKKNVINGNHKS